ncbi:MAG: response regulator [Chloroflexi bacterium]|nr:response regulator [Chloroflexota bacterium]
MMEQYNDIVAPPSQTILLINDEPTNQEILVNYLFEQNFRVITALTGEQGVELAQQELPDIILLDVVLPGIDGFETCRRLKANEQTREIPIVFIAVMASAEKRVNGFAVGGVDWLTKPFQREEALARVSIHLRLRELTGQLEQKVQERTKELMIANQQLQEEIAERNRVEIALRSSESSLREQVQQVRSIIDTVPEGVIMLSSEGDILLTNSTAEQYLSLLAPDWKNGRLTTLGAYLLTNLLSPPPKGLWHELIVNNKRFETIAHPIENESQTKGWILLLRDITQERDIQRQMQEQERLAAIGQLAAGIAHDFNNIMSIISLYTQLTVKLADLPPQAQKRLKIIEQQAHRASDLIQQILDFSRQAIIERRPVNLLRFLKESVKLLMRTLPESIQIEFNTSEDDFIIDADPARIQQVIMNLALNARDAMPEGGQLTINLTTTHLLAKDPVPMSGMKAGDWVKIEVTDSGSGILPAELPRIFEPFFTTKEAGKGTGLGLAQVYGIVQQHEGFIDVISNAGFGTTFLLYFPAVVTDNLQDHINQSTSLPQGQKQLILVVEDNRVARQVLVETLETLNYRTLEAENGRSALTILKQPNHGIAMILSDAVMPEMGGSALLHMMKAHNINLPFIIITGHPMDQNIGALRNMGLNAWLAKPPKLIELANLLAKTLN